MGEDLEIVPASSAPKTKGKGGLAIAQSALSPVMAHDSPVACI